MDERVNTPAEVATKTNELPVESRRQLIRFGMRTMFVSVTVVAVLMWLGWKLFGYAGDTTENYYVGLTEEEIVNRLGRPSVEWNGHFGSPNWNWANQFKQPRTLCYRRLSGTLYISVCDKDGKRVCFTSSWLSRGRRY